MKISGRSIIAALVTLMVLQACADLEPKKTQKHTGGGVADSSIQDGPAPDGAAADQALADGVTADLSPDAGLPADLQLRSYDFGPWSQDCLALPNNNLYETGCQQAMSCEGGKLGSAWAGDGTQAYGTTILDTQQKVEQAMSLRIDCDSAKWCGVTYECPETPEATNTIDLSGVKLMHLALRGSSPEVVLKMASLPYKDYRDEGEAYASKYGYLPDGQWHEIAIPIADFQQAPGSNAANAFDLSKIYKPLIVSLYQIDPTQSYSLNVDAVYFTM